MLYGMCGIIFGVLVVIFVFVGFDIVVTCVEEVVNFAVDLSFGILGSFGICVVLYCVMCVVIMGMVLYDDIDVNVLFVMVFMVYGMFVIVIIVFIGVVVVITTSLLFSMMG